MMGLLHIQQISVWLRCLGQGGSFFRSRCTWIWCPWQMLQWWSYPLWDSTFWPLYQNDTWRASALPHQRLDLPFSFHSMLLRSTCGYLCLLLWCLVLHYFFSRIGEDVLRCSRVQRKCHRCAEKWLRLLAMETADVFHEYRCWRALVIHHPKIMALARRFVSCAAEPVALCDLLWDQCWHWNTLAVSNSPRRQGEYLS